MANRICSFPDCGKTAYTVSSGLCAGHYRQQRDGESLTPILRTFAARFWAKVDKTATCWLWTGSTDSNGYGQIWTNERRLRSAHRMSLHLAGVPIPDGLEVDHLCRNRACVRPDHLEPVTHAENVDRAPYTAVHFQLAKQVCPQGHPYTPDNIYMKPNASGRFSRECRTCKRARANVGRRARLSPR